MDASILLQLIINGVLLGGVYAMAAFGLSLVFGVSGVLNLAHGEFLMLSGTLVFIGYDVFGLNPIFSALGVVPLFFGIGLVFERVLIRPLHRQEMHIRLASATLVTLGVALMAEDVVAYLSVGQVFERSIDLWIPTLEIGELYLPSLKLIMFAIVLCLIVLLFAFLRFTYTGLAVRAVTSNRRGALLSGIPIQRIHAQAFALGAALAAMAGTLEVIHSSVSPIIGLPLTLKYLAIIVMGGLGSFLGVALGSIIIGLGESFVSFFNPGWGQTVAFLLLVMVLLIRPKGLLGR